MQDDIESKTIKWVISTSKLTARTIIRTGIAYLRGHSNPRGKQSIKKLVGQNKGVTNIEIEKTSIRGHERYAKKYSIDFAITKDKSAIPPRYMIFSKTQDKDALTAAFQGYSTSAIKKRSQKPSMLNQLHDLIQQVAEPPGKMKEKKQERAER